MVENNLLFAIVITLISISFLILINYFFREFRFTPAINFVFVCESIVLTFFFQKFPSVLSLLILLVSLFFITREYNNYFKGMNNYVPSSNLVKKLIKTYNYQIGILLIIIVFSYEIFGDHKFSSNSLLLFSIGLLFIFFNKFPDEYQVERNFLLFFFSLLFCVFFGPHFIHKIFTGTMGQTSSFEIFQTDKIVYYFLAKPLSLILSTLGYNVFASGQNISFEDLDAGYTRTLSVAKSCSGITSIQVFSSALISYFITVRGKFDILAFLILILGAFTAYFANLLRMSVIVLVGHYYGMDALQWAHEYVGWLIFTAWILLFWIMLDLIFDFNSYRSQTNYNSTDIKK